MFTSYAVTVAIEIGAVTRFSRIDRGCTSGTNCCTVCLGQRPVHLSGLWCGHAEHGHAWRGVGGWAHPVSLVEEIRGRTPTGALEVPLCQPRAGMTGPR
ncbi:MAG TPA: hypothetical protein VK096_05965, partial [Actinomycetales bacterium]|nr:hypothetical protein [Actinomycetales bacterium]